MSGTRKSGGGTKRTYKGQHRFEHWYRDNQVYFLTARCKGRHPAFASSEAKAVFWMQFDRYTREYNFTPFVTSLIDNHYHTLGYLQRGEALGTMMHRIHGSTAKLVNDLFQNKYQAERLKPLCLNTQGRLLPFWKDAAHKNYFDGCIRNESQCRKTYHYICIQAERHGITTDWRTYPHTRIDVGLETAVRHAHKRDAFLEHVRYKRYNHR